MSLHFPRALGRLVATLPLILSVGACDQEPSIGALVDDYVEVANAQLYTACDCWQEWGDESRSDCIGDDELLPSQRRCIESALERDEEAARNYMQCLLPLQEEYLSCLESRLVCEDTGSVDACADDFEVGVQNCIELPATIDRAWADCFADADG